ncbi:MAG TPA: hypothetical protein VF088_14035 [Pyrinomonadaceae bacterium]
MNSRLKKILAINLTLLVLLLPLLSAAQSPIPRLGKVFISYGVEPTVPIPNKLIRRPTIPPRPTVPEIRRSPEIFRRAGGIMFDAVGVPCDALANAQLRLSYNPQRPDGQRLTLHLRNRAYSIPGISDNYLQPTAKFVDSKNPIIANLQSPDEDIRESCPSPSNRLRVVTLHPAFVNIELGWSAIRMDSIPWSFSKGLRWDKNEPVPEATRELSKTLANTLRADEAEYSKKILSPMRVRLFNRAVIALAAMTAVQKQQLTKVVKSLTGTGHDWTQDENEILAAGVDPSVWKKLNLDDQRIILLMLGLLFTERVSNLNDAGSPATFCIQDSTIQLDGLPNLEFIGPQYSQTFILPASSKLMTEKLPELRAVDPEAYDGMITVYRLGGLFRYVKEQSPFHWQQFVKTLPRPEKRETYTILCPSCPVDKVKQWVACVDKNFPA